MFDPRLDDMSVEPIEEMIVLEIAAIIGIIGIKPAVVGQVIEQLPV